MTGGCIGDKVFRVKRKKGFFDITEVFWPDKNDIDPKKFKSDKVVFYTYELTKNIGFVETRHSFVIDLSARL